MGAPLFCFYDSRSIPSGRRRSDRRELALASLAKPPGACLLAIDASYLVLTAVANVPARKTTVLIRNPLAARRPRCRPLPQGPALPHPPNFNRHRRSLSGSHKGGQLPTVFPLSPSLRFPSLRAVRKKGGVRSFRSSKPI